LFPKGLSFATVDAFFAELAISDELQLVLAQARDVYKNQNIQHNTFVKRLMEMAGLEPDVLRAMYESKKEKAEKGGK
jgi:proline dehydrogenase